MKAVFEVDFDKLYKETVKLLTELEKLVKQGKWIQAHLTASRILNNVVLMTALVNKELLNMESVNVKEVLDKAREVIEKKRKP